MSQSHYKFVLVDCFYEVLYKQGLLNQVNEALHYDRVNLIKQFKLPLFNALKTLKEKYLESNYIRKESENLRVTIVSVIGDISQSFQVHKVMEQIETVREDKLNSLYLGALVQDALTLASVSVDLKDHIHKTVKSELQLLLLDL